MFLTSCEKKELVTPVEGEEQQQEGDRKAFAVISDNEFKSILTGESEFVAEEGFVSMLDILTQIDSTNNEQEYLRLIEEHKDILIFDEDGTPELIVESSGLASMLSPKGYLQVGDKIMKIGYNTVKTIEDGDVSKINLLDEINATDETKNVTVHKITRQASLKYTSTHSYYHGSYKLNVKKYAINYGTFITVGGKLTHWEWGKNGENGNIETALLKWILE